MTEGRIEPIIEKVSRIRMHVWYPDDQILTLQMSPCGRLLSIQNVGPRAVAFYITDLTKLQNKPVYIMHIRDESPIMGDMDRWTYMTSYLWHSGIETFCSHFFYGEGYPEGEQN